MLNLLTEIFGRSNFRDESKNCVLSAWIINELGKMKIALFMPKLLNIEKLLYVQKLEDYLT